MVVMGRKRLNRSYYFTKSFEKLKMMKSRLSFIGQFLFWPDAKNGNIFASRSWWLFKDFDFIVRERLMIKMIITECISLFSDILADLEFEIKQLRLKEWN